MGRKRRKIVKRAPRRIPRVFYCPLCNQQAVTVVNVTGYSAEVSCGSCGTSVTVPWYRSSLPVDAYSTWYDVVTGRRKREEVEAEVERLRQLHEGLAEELVEALVGEGEGASGEESSEAGAEAEAEGLEGSESLELSQREEPEGGEDEAGR
ncbi:MAG: transcription elongation factor 1 family protein [Nitrososphaerota archaeon]|nr:transcription elongation factor 1 family protein [Candidatus Calditenuis fumarioli]